MVWIFYLSVALFSSKVFAGAPSYDEYSRLQGELRSYLALPTAIASYHGEYDEAIAQQSSGSRILQEEDLPGLIRGSNITMVADYHPEPAYKDQLEALIPVFSRVKRHPVLVLEWIDQSLQNELDDFLVGKISEEGLRLILADRNNWTFIANRYFPMLVLARNYGMQVLLAESFSSGRRLKERDQAIAQLISAHRQRNPESSYLIFYGAAHLLGEGHLGDELIAVGFSQPMVVTGYADAVFWSYLDEIESGQSLVLLGEHLVYQYVQNPLERIEHDLRLSRYVNQLNSLEFDDQI